MPYITDEARERLGERPDALTPGELNAQLTVLCDDYLLVRGGPKYSTINEIIGVLECAKLEFYRRIASPYEDKKMIENGDVYSPENLTKNE